MPAVERTERRGRLGVEVAAAAYMLALGVLDAGSQSSWQRMGSQGSGQVACEKGKVAGQSGAGALSIGSVVAVSAAVWPDPWRLRRRWMGRRRPPPLEAGVLEASQWWRIRRPPASGAGGKFF